MTTIKSHVIAASAATLLARVTKASGAAAQQADISAIRVRVYDRETATQVGSDYTPSVSTVVSDTLQTDARWTEDSTGYNLAIDLAGSYWPTGGTTYRVEAKLTPTSGNPFYVLWDVQAARIYSE